MSDQIINYYDFPGHQPDLEMLKQRFGRNMSKFNVPFFENNSEIEQSFLSFCRASNLPIDRKTVIEYGGNGAGEEKFLFLCLKDDDGTCFLDRGRSFIDLSASCPGGGTFGVCGRGAKQIGRFALRPEGVELVVNFGILAARFPITPKIYLISAFVADSLKKAKATGCEILLTDTPDCFQLCITAETLGPTQIGQAKMGKRCPICGMAKMFVGSSVRHFHQGDLGKSDFQMCRFYAADNIGQFEILNGFPIVSKRIFDVFLAFKIKGLDDYSTDPPIRHAVVQIK